MPAIAIDPSNFDVTSSRESYDLGNFSREVIEAVAGGVGNQETEQIDLSEDTNRILMGDIGSGWTIKNPLELEVQQAEDGDFVISDNEFGFYGEGRDLEEAEEDYLAALKTHYKIYKDHLDENEDPITLKRFNYIRNFIVAPDHV